MWRPSARTRDVLIVLATAVLFQLVAIVRSRDRISPDSGSYLEPARNLLAGRGFTDLQPPGFAVADDPSYPRHPGPETFRVPGYPIFLAAVFWLGGGVGAVVAIQHLLVMSFAVAVYWYVLAATRQRSIALTAALLCASFLPLAVMAHIVLTETLFTALLLVTVIAAESALRRGSVPLAMMAGVATSCAMLTRPIALFFVLPMAGVFLLRRRPRVLLAAAYVAAFTLPAATWIARNYRVSGVATVSSSSNANLLYQWAAAIEVTEHASHRDRLTAVQRQMGFRAPLHRVRRALRERAFELVRRDGKDPLALSPAQQSVYLRRVASGIIRNHPLQLAELMTSAVIEMHLLEPASIPLKQGVRNEPGMVLFMPFAVAAFVLMIVGTRALWTINRDLALLIAATIVYFTVVSAIPEPEARYAAVFAPEYSVALAAGCVYVASASQWRARRAGIAGPQSIGPL